MKAYRVTRENKEVWEGYQSANLDSALATAYTWQKENYNYKTQKYPCYEIYECNYQVTPWGGSAPPIKECNPRFVGFFTKDGRLKILK